MIDQSITRRRRHARAIGAIVLSFLAVFLVFTVPETLGFGVEPYSPILYGWVFVGAALGLFLIHSWFRPDSRIAV